MSVIVNESNISKQLSEFWDLENLGIEAEVSDEENIDNDIMSEFEAGISYQNKRVNPISFVADIEMTFLMIEIDKSERDFTRFFWDENPGIDLENKRLDIFRMTRVLFGVKSSPFLLAATIKHHLKNMWIFPDTFNHLNQSLYVDDFLCGNVSVQTVLTTCIESKQIFEDARLDWDDKLPKQLEVSWNKWCNEIHNLSEIKIPRYYFQNFLPSNATTIQFHCFSDASKKAYGTVAYLRIELNDGNIISSFVASKVG
ncbi:integrase catalytic domain-containing protein [Trichonephila clavipes]|nr:integrase catalytic domain-containing protein [Trichonephila clavipes]